MARQAPTFPSGYAVFHAKVVGCPQPKFGRLREKALSLRRVAGGGGEKFGVPANLPNRNACRQPEPEMMVWHHSQRQRSRYRRTMPVVPQLGHVWGGVAADWWAGTGGSDAAGYVSGKGWASSFAGGSGGRAGEEAAGPYRPDNHAHNSGTLAAGTVSFLPPGSRRMGAPCSRQPWATACVTPNVWAIDRQPLMMVMPDGSFLIPADCGKSFTALWMPKL